MLPGDFVLMTYGRDQGRAARPREQFVRLHPEFTELGAQFYADPCSGRIWWRLPFYQAACRVFIGKKIALISGVYDPGPCRAIVSAGRRPSSPPDAGGANP